MKDLFEYVRDSILHGMPAGCLVTKDAINFDIGMWQHKTYDYTTQIYSYLRSKWTRHSINLIILDDVCAASDLINFIEENSFDSKWRNIYFVYCIAIKTNNVTSELYQFLKTKKYPMNSYHQKIIYKDYTIFICDLVQNLLYY